MKAVTITGILIIVSLVFSASAIQAQSTAFTYQGRLSNGSPLANGSYDFQFTLFGALTGGTQIGTLTKSGVTVTGGLFTVTLDFGAAAFPGADRWLAISARQTGAPAFTPLTPRQQTSPNPYAIRAQSASTSDTATNATQLGGVAASQYVTTTGGNANFIQNQSASAQAGSFNVSGNGAIGGNLTVSGTLNAVLPANSTSYIHNTNNQQPNSNFNIGGDGRVAGLFSGDTINAVTQYNIGSQRLLTTDGSSSISLGLFAGASGDQNSFFGVHAGTNNTTGSLNSFFGYQTGSANTTGNNNVFVGSQAGAGNTGDDNTFIGTLTGAQNTTGTANVFIGSGAGLRRKTENYNTFIGFDADGGNGVTNSTAIGANAFVTTSNSIVLGSVFGSNGGTTNVNVGIGTTAPAFKLHIVDSNFPTIKLDGSNNLGTWIELNNTSTGGHNWGILSSGNQNGEGAGNLVIADQTGNGRIIMNNALTVPSCIGCAIIISDRNLKANFAVVNNRSVLERLADIPIQTWNYKSDKASLRHIGPMAQNFFTAFGLGEDDKHINLIDEGGVALAAIQELYRIDQAKDQEITDLKAANVEMSKRLEALEKAVEKLTKQNQ